jgi:glycosyltransferase involved in cell wall biosynthesis
MKKIALVTSPEPSFNEKKVATQISEIIGSKYHVDIITGKSNWPDITSDNINIYKYGGETNSIFGIRWVTISLKKHNQCRPVDIVLNVSKISTIGLAVSLFGLLNNVETIIRFTGDAGHDPFIYDTIKNIISKGVLHNIIPAVVGLLADYCIALGPEYYNKLTMYKSKDKVFMLPQPIQSERFRHVPKHKIFNLRRKLGLKESDKMVLYVGRVSWHKGSDKIMKIAKRIYEEDKSISFCLVGEVIDSNLCRGNKPPNIKTVGPVNNDIINIYYNAADILVFPSRAEGLPNVILEALSAEIPVIASPVGEIKYFVSNTSEKIEGYVDFILNTEQAPDSIPATMEWENLRDRYISVFNDVL